MSDMHDIGKPVELSCQDHSDLPPWSICTLLLVPVRTLPDNSTALQSNAMPRAKSDIAVDWRLCSK